MNVYGPVSDDPRRAADRILDTAEGVVITLRRCSLNAAFMEIMRTARRHNVNPLTLADVLVALAEKKPTADLDAKTVAVARGQWGALLSQTVRQLDSAIGPDSVEPGHDAPSQNSDAT